MGGKLLAKRLQAEEDTAFNALLLAQNEGLGG